MRTTALRHVVRLRLTLVGVLPEIWRDVVIDRDLALGDLRRVIQAVFEGQICRHHLFTDNLDSHGWTRTRRRWGDRWTMIDFRDPTVIDEATARIGRVLRDARPLYYGHTCENGWLVEIEAREDDLVPASIPAARVIGGERRAPLGCCRGPYEHAVLVGVLEDLDHPEREALLSRLESTTGPWSHFDPEEFTLADAQRRIDLLDLGTPDTDGGQRPRRTGPLERIIQWLPRAARVGLEQHLAASGLDLPTVVTTDEARAATREFRWVVSRAAEGGIRLIDGTVDPDVVQAGGDALGCDEDRMLQLITFAKRGRLLYARHGRLRANKRSAAAAEDPSELWSLLARELVRSVAPSRSGDLFLLAIADGSLADPAIGVRRSAEALALLRRGWPRAPRYGGAYGYDDTWRHDDTWGYDDSWGHDGPRGDGCEQACDCPSDGSGTWHELVARAIRHAAAEGAGEGAAPVAARFTGPAARELGFAPEWFDAPTSSPYLVATRTAEEIRDDETAMLGELDDLIRLLSMFGLEHADDGAWIVPPILREFARESLQRPMSYQAF